MRTLLPLVLLLSCLSLSGQYSIDSLRLKAESLGPDTLKVKTYIRLGFTYNRINYDSALYYNRKAELLSRELGSEDFLGRSKYRIATVLIQKNQFDLAEAELDTAIKLLSSAASLQQLLGSKVALAKLHQKRSDFDRATAAYFEALPLAEEIGDKNTKAGIYNYLASIYNFQKQYKLAISYYRPALKLVEELNFKPGISAVLTNLGNAHLQLKNYDSAFFYQRKALRIKLQMGDKLGTARVYSNLANTFLDSGSPHLDSALYFFNAGFAIGQELQDRRVRADNLYGIVRINFMKGDTRQAKRSSDLLLQELDSLYDLPLAVNSYELISLVYTQEGDTEKAFQYRAKSESLEDSLLRVERIQLARELEAKYQNETKQKAIELLEAENELQELQINKRRSERNGLVALSIGVLVVLALLINRYRLKQAANKQLRELDRIKSIFFENLSHEFRTPLSLIIAPIRDRLSKASKREEKELFEMVLRNAENLDDLVKQLLDLAKLEKGKFELKPSPTETSNFFRVITASYESLAVMKSIAFEISIPNEERWLELDQDVVKKICNNLLSNAFKFTPNEGSIHFKLTYRESLILEVSDSGPGIASEDQDQIFDRFFQVEGPHHSGTGIGLALTKELVLATKGTISLKSEPGAGSRFTVSLPMHLATAQEQATQVADSLEAAEDEILGGSSLSPEKQSLLIIEDNSDLRTYVASLFRETFNIHTAVNGEEGIKLAEETIPDLIISDIMMEAMDGLEVCEHLKSDQKTDHIPIVLLTARADQETKLKGLKHGADAYLLKPFEPEELRATVQNLITQRQKLRDKYTTPDSADEPIKPLFIQKSEEIVLTHLSDESFSADDFAKEIGMSRMQVHRKLKAMTGLSTTAFVRHQRLQKAKELLEQGETVSQVAYAVGFSSLAYFTKSFKEQFGSVPSQVGKAMGHALD